MVVLHILRLQVRNLKVVTQFAKAETLTASRPEKVIFKFDVGEGVWIFDHFLIWLSKMNVVVALLVLAQIQRKGVPLNQACILECSDKGWSPFEISIPQGASDKWLCAS